MSTWQKWMTPGIVAGLLVVAPSARAQDDGRVLSRDDASEQSAGEEEGGSRVLESSSDDAREEQFNRELLTIEEEVNSLKERVFRSKATLQLLAEIVAQGTGTGSRATITHINGLGRAYKVESLSYYLDGQARYSRSSGEGLDDIDEIKVFDGPISAGSHNLSVTMQLRGSGGVFSYVDEIGFNVQSNATFEVQDGDSCDVRVEADERGGLSRSFTERPDITFDVRCTRSTEDAGDE